MQHPLLSHLAGYRIILASGSPRRKQILLDLGLSFEVIVLSGIEEDYPPHLATEEVAPFLSKQKAKAYSHLLEDQKSIVITADTIVVIDNRILGKPEHVTEAFQMLQLLSGRDHVVITAVTLCSHQKEVTFTAKTKVWFRPLSDSEINHYISHYQPFDKAGSYGIQEWIGMIGIEKVEGSYYNVVGLPAQQLFYELERF